MACDGDGVESPTAVPLLCALVWFYACVCLCVCEAGRGSGGSRIAIAFLEVSMYHVNVAAREESFVFVDKLEFK